MGYTFRTACFACVLVWAALAVTPVSAQSDDSLGTATPTLALDATQPPTTTTEADTASATSVVSPTATLTAVAAETALAADADTARGGGR